MQFIRIEKPTLDWSLEVINYACLFLNASVEKNLKKTLVKIIFFRRQRIFLEEKKSPSLKIE